MDVETMRKTLEEARKKWRYGGSEYVLILRQAGLLSDDEDYILFEDYYDGEAISFAIKVLDKIIAG